MYVHVSILLLKYQPNTITKYYTVCYILIHIFHLDGKEVDKLKI